MGRDRWRLLKEGRFFGVVCAGDDIFAFNHGSASDPDRNSGRVIRYVRRGGELVEAGTVVEGLDRQVHQLDYFDGAFFIVDTRHQRILEYDEDWEPVTAHQLLPPAERGGPEYAHLNSIAGCRETIWVMLHNGPRGRPSEILELDRAFNERRRLVLPCNGCHDVVPLPDGRLLTCLSPRGEILVGESEVHPIDALWTRGVVVGPDEVVVGSSFYGKRIMRTILPGFLTFLDPAFRRIGRVRIPAGPTQIRPLNFFPF